MWLMLQLTLVVTSTAYNFQVPSDVIANEAASSPSAPEVLDSLIVDEHAYLAQLSYSDDDDDGSDEFVDVVLTANKYALDRPENGRFLSQRSCQFGHVYGYQSSAVFLLKSGNVALLNSLPYDRSCQLQVFNMTSCSANSALNILPKTSCEPTSSSSSFVLYDAAFDLFLRTNLSECGYEFCPAKYSFDYSGYRIGERVPFPVLPDNLKSNRPYDGVRSVSAESPADGYLAIDTGTPFELSTYYTSAKGKLMHTYRFAHPYFDYAKNGETVTILHKMNKYVHGFLQNDEHYSKFKLAAEIAIPPKYKILSFRATKDYILAWTFDTSATRNRMGMYKIHAINKNGNVVNTFEFARPSSALPLVEIYNSTVKAFSIHETPTKLCFEFCPKHSLERNEGWPKYVLTCVDKHIVVGSLNKQEIMDEIQAKNLKKQLTRARSFKRILASRHYFNNIMRTLKEKIISYN